MKNNWITVKEDVQSSCPLFFNTFVLEDNKKVTLDISAAGLYKVFINKKEITNRILTPGLTSYIYRVMYQTYDISEFVNKGENLIEVLVAPGWAVGHYGLYNVQHYLCDKIALNLELYSNDKLALTSDTSFSARESFIDYSDIYNGEMQDYTKTSLKDYEVICFDKEINVVPNEGEDIIEREIVKSVELIVTPKGERIIDFGQNLAGYISLLKPKAGIYKFNFCEVLDKDGNFYNENYRGIWNVIQYKVKGDEELVKPWFTFQGFRYALIEEWPEDVEIDLSKIQAIVIYSNIERISNFKTDNAKLNKLYSNIIWGQKGNFIDIPTDCPQRDERLGWLGDAAVFARTACYNFDCTKFYDKWLKDVELEQTPEGGVRGFVPHVLKDNYEISAGWGDACIIVPYEVYDATGNKDILRKYLPMMKKWVEYMHNSGPEEYLWIGHFSFGDWLAMDLPEGNYVGATQKDFISSAYFYKTTKMLAEIVSVLGEDNSYYVDMAAKIKKSFREYFMKDGLPVLNYSKQPYDPNKPDIAITQTSLSMLLNFGLYEGEKERNIEAAKLNELVINNGNKLTTGFLGTPLLLSALSDNGYIKTAVELLLQEEFPSWLFSVNRGATTMWEHWDGMNEKGEFWSKDMNSFNHYAYGAVLTWIIENIIGLKRLKPGYKSVRVEPYFDERIGNNCFSIKTPYGNINISNSLVNGKVVTCIDADKNIDVVK